MVLRDKDYLNWRYISHPTRNYNIYRAIEKDEMKGFIILRKTKLMGFNCAVIVDLLSIDEKALHVLIERGISYSKDEKVDLVCFMVPKTHKYYKIFKKCGFFRSPKTFRFMIYPHENKKELLDPKNWYVTWGDTDVI